MQSISRGRVQAFYQAYMTRDAAKIEPFLHDDVQWLISGPVDLMAFCGQHCGKAAVLEFFHSLVPSILRVTGMEPAALLVDGDRASMLFKLTGLMGEEQRKISYQVAQFVRFCDNKVLELRSIMDSFDAAEQLIGHPIELPERKHVPARAAAGDLVAV
jgi:ketosteroid isomerase-like protein